MALTHFCRYVECNAVKETTTKGNTMKATTNYTNQALTILEEVKIRKSIKTKLETLEGIRELKRLQTELNAALAGLQNATTTK